MDTGTVGTVHGGGREAAPRPTGVVGRYGGQPQRRYALKIVNCRIRP
jgi:hypothetical protein